MKLKWRAPRNTHQRANERAKQTDGPTIGDGSGGGSMAIIEMAASFRPPVRRADNASCWRRLRAAAAASEEAER